MNKASLLIVGLSVLAYSFTGSSRACCSLHPAKFSGTKGLAAETLKDGKLVHLLGYQNSVTNKTFNVQGRGTGNAMLLPIPAKPGSMSKYSILDTSSCPAILEDMKKAIDPPSEPDFPHRRMKAMKSSHTLEVFKHDIYTIVLAQNAEDVPAALSQVPEDQRPALNPAIFKRYAQWYKGWTFALCCFNSTQEAKAKPMLWWYEPINPQMLFFPALDAHDGNPPDLRTSVVVDHTIIASSHKMLESTGHPVAYSNKLSVEPSMRKLLPTRVIGSTYKNQTMPNGDFVFVVSEVRQGKFNPQRQLPPGAKSGKRLAAAQR